MGADFFLPKSAPPLPFFSLLQYSCSSGLDPHSHSLREKKSTIFLSLRNGPPPLGDAHRPAALDPERASFGVPQYEGEALRFSTLGASFGPV